MARKQRLVCYDVVLHKSKYGYDVHCPALPGCHSQGDTLEEAVENIKDAIQTYLEMVEEDTKKCVRQSKNWARREIEVPV